MENLYMLFFHVLYTHQNKTKILYFYGRVEDVTESDSQRPHVMVTFCYLRFKF